MTSLRAACRHALLISLLALSALPGCGGGSKDTYVLVHGSWFGAWCWDKVKPLLEQAGHTVITVDLPAHGSDQTPLAEASLQSYTDRVRQIVEAQPRPVILVGHSMAGIVISQVAEARPDKIRALVYVAAFLVQSGQTLVQITQEDTDSQLGPHLQFAPDQSYAMVDPAFVHDVFCADCSSVDDQLVSARMTVREPTAPLATPIQVSAARWGSVPRVYVETLQDRVLSNTEQRRLYGALSVDRVLTIDSSHSPFLSQPGALAAQLSSL
ncbi:MAG TPA: alpha/beta fold hydrolase [Polyangia bacterium]|nr:alpha/beta fold hydrolase [Polyangia bacterium]